MAKKLFLGSAEPPLFLKKVYDFHAARQGIFEENEPKNWEKIGPKRDLHGSKVGLFSENDHFGGTTSILHKRQAPYFSVLRGGRQRFECRNADILM